MLKKAITPWGGVVEISSDYTPETAGAAFHAWPQVSGVGGRTQNKNMKLQPWPMKSFGNVPPLMTAAPFYFSRAILSTCFHVRVLPFTFSVAGGTTAPFR
jgi:hypothetical protein